MRGLAACGKEIGEDSTPCVASAESGGLAGAGAPGFLKCGGGEMTVFTNATFISCEEQSRSFSTMVVDKGRICYTGDEIPTAYSKAKRVDLGGRCVVPAFADTHIHFESYALFLSTLDVREAKDLEDMARMVKTYFSANPKVKFLPAFGCSVHTLRENRLPERRDLDKMTDIPFLIVKYDGHAGVANTAFIDSLPEGVKKDPGFDEETGWMYQNAFYEAVNYMTSKVSPLKVLQSLAGASDAMAKKGIGLIHTVEGVGYKNDIDVDTMRLVSRSLPQAFRLFFQTTEVEKVTKRGLPRIGGCFRLALDGCFGSEDAALSQPYENNPENKGFLLYSQEEVNDFCIRANRLGLQISMHAIGDVAVDQALTAYETALKDFPRENHRHIIIHADLIPEEMQERAAALGICIAVQPAFLYWKHEPAEYLESILGERAIQMLPLKSLIEKGIILSAGSDAPCTLPDPISSIHFCCNHPNPEQRIDVLDALRMHTSWAAYMSFDEHERGTLQEGYIADFVVLSESPLALSPDQISRIKVEETYFSGEKYQKTISKPLSLVCKALLGRAR